LTIENLNQLPKEELKIMRNEIFARHGYIFKADDLTNYFSEQDWYNPQFNDISDRLTPIEKENIGLIKQFEASN
jgi:hypothetical protein